jgi:hypothetical protein
MIRKLMLLLLAFTLVQCVPLSQQATYQTTGEELPIVSDTKLYAELKSVIENGINEYFEGSAKWEGSCLENPLFTQRFQSGYSISGSSAFRISDHVLTLNISYGGGCGCSQKLMVWNGNLVTDAQGRKIAELVFSFKSNDLCRAIVYTKLVYDLKTLNLPKGEEVYIRVNNFPGLEIYRPS